MDALGDLTDERLIEWIGDCYCMADVAERRRDWALYRDAVAELRELWAVYLARSKK